MRCRYMLIIRRYLPHTVQAELLCNFPNSFIFSNSKLGIIGQNPLFRTMPISLEKEKLHALVEAQHQEKFPLYVWVRIIVVVGLID